MRKRDFLYSIVVGTLFYIVDSLFSGLAYLNAKSSLHDVFFILFLVLGSFLFVFGIQYKSEKISQKIIRLVFIIIFRFLLLILGGYLGVFSWYQGLLPLSKSSVRDNVSGLLLTLFYLITTVSGILSILFSVLLKIIKRIIITYYNK